MVPRHDVGRGKQQNAHTKKVNSSKIREAKYTYSDFTHVLLDASAVLHQKLGDFIVTMANSILQRSRAPTKNKKYFRF